MEMLIFPVHRVVELKRIIRKKWRAEEEERHKGSLTTPPPHTKKPPNTIEQFQVKLLILTSLNSSF
jgi:hypothetical protein